jgi:hypothetical protein
VSEGELAQPTGEARFALRARARFVVPAAIALGLVGAALASEARARLFCAVMSAAIAALWGASRLLARILAVDEQGYRVVRRARVLLSVRWDEVKRARAVPAEQALYLDTGEPARNLLLPTRHGYGFRFARQAELYTRIARALGDRLEVVPTLEPAPRGTGLAAAREAPQPPTEPKK